MNKDKAGVRRVLLVDDEPSVLRMMTRYLERHGYAAVGVRTAEEAFDELAAEKFDLVVLDNGLPGAMGIVALPKIVERFGVPVIMVSGFLNDDVVQDALILGAASFLAKPLDLEGLLGKIHGVLS